MCVCVCVCVCVCLYVCVCVFVCVSACGDVGGRHSLLHLFIIIYFFLVLCYTESRRSRNLSMLLLLFVSLSTSRHILKDSSFLPLISFLSIIKRYNATVPVSAEDCRRHHATVAGLHPHVTYDVHVQFRPKDVLYWSDEAKSSGTTMEDGA